MQTPVLAREEYIEQAYFFRAFRERILEGQPAQVILRHLADELLSTTRLPLAVQFLLDEMKHTGFLSNAAAALPHYFTPFQTLVLEKAEDEGIRFTMEQALLILEREALYRSGEPTPQGLFIFQLETLSRNRLGYSVGLKSMEGDGFYDEHWIKYFRLIRGQLGERDFADLVFVRSEYFVQMRRQSDPDYEPGFQVLFAEKEGRIAAANRGKDPMYLFATLQRQLGYPEVPRLPRADSEKNKLDELEREVERLRKRLELVEAELKGQLDISQFYVKPPKSSQEGGKT